MRKLFIAGGKFVGLTGDGKVSLPKGCAPPPSSEVKVWRGKLLGLMRLHHHCTPNGKKVGREGVDGAKAAQAAGNDPTRKTLTESRSDTLPSHIAQWDALLARATDPVVFAVQRRIVQSEEILYSQLHRHLHHAVFADDNVIMLERMPRTALRGRFEASDMIGLLCWLARDIEGNVALPKPLPDNIRGLAEDFADRHLLHHDASLFGTDCQPIRYDLRTIFEEVRRYHPPVDADTEDIIDVIENYLYAGKKLENSGTNQHGHVLFGSEFFDVWEMLCLYHAYENDIGKDEWKVLIADGGNLPEWLQEDATFKNNLALRTTYPAQLKDSFKEQRPDLIIYKEDGDTVNYRVIDFKYYEWSDLRTKPNLDKLNNSEKKFFLGVVKDDILNLSKSDIAKSWGYAQSVLKWHNESKKMQGKKISINMEFWLPSDKNPLSRDYSAGKLYAKPISSMIDELLKESPSPWLEH